MENKIIIDAPAYGWVNLNFENKKNNNKLLISASYLTNVAIDILEALYNLKKDNIAQIITIDTENDGEFNIVFFPLNSIGIIHYEDYFLCEYEEDNYVNIILSNIENNLEKWKNWGYAVEDICDNTVLLEAYIKALHQFDSCGNKK